MSGMAEFGPAGLMDALIDHVITLSQRAVSEVKAGRLDSREFNTFFQLFGECLMANVESLTCSDREKSVLRYVIYLDVYGKSIFVFILFFLGGVGVRGEYLQQCP